MRWFGRSNSPGPELRGVEHSLKLQACYEDVIRALEAFERAVEDQAPSKPQVSEEQVT